MAYLFNYLLSGTNTIAALLHTTSLKTSSYYPIELHNILQHRAYKLKLASIWRGITRHPFREQICLIYFFNKQCELLRSPSSLRRIAFLGTDVCLSCVWAEGPRGDLLCTHTDKAMWFDRCILPVADQSPGRQ